MLSITVPADTALAQAITGTGDTSSSNTPVITNPPSPFDAGSALTIGNNLPGTLTISGGAVVLLGSEDPVSQDRVSTIGAEASGNGSVIVTGPSLFNFGTVLTVGRSGTGSLIVEAGATVTNSGTASNGLQPSVDIGQVAGANGSIIVRGPGSALNHGNLILIGEEGTGSLAVLAGARVINDGMLPDGSPPRSEIGYGADGDGSVLVSGGGSFWDTGPRLTVGRSGTALLTIEAGGHVLTQAGDFNTLLGANDIGAGTVLVSGQDSLWSAGARLLVGVNGTGTLEIADGGRVESTVAIAIAGGGGNGTVTVQGTSSRLDAGENLFVGLGGTGFLRIAGGGSALSSGITEIGGGEGVAPVGDADGIASGAGTGSVTVTGSGSSLAAGDVLNIASRGDGTLTIEEGGIVTSNQTTNIGAGPGTQGNVTVTGPGSSLQTGTAMSVGVAGNGTLSIGDGAAVSSGTIDIAVQPAATGTINLAGDLQADTIVFGQGTGTINFNRGSAAYIFSSDMSGAGTLNMVSGETILTGDSGAFTGSTHVTGGQLIVNGTLGGAIDIGAGTLLGGIGTIGSTVIGNGGVLSPGNSIGTINVAGDLTFNPGSVYRVEVDPAGSNDKTLVSGVATLAGHVEVAASAGNWRWRTPYTILSAAGGLNGTRFLDVSSNLLFLDPTLTYSPNDVTLTLRRNDILISDVAKTPNQLSAARSVDDFIAKVPDGDNPLVENLMNLDPVTASLTIAQLPGEIHVSTASVLLDDSRFIGDAENNRLRAAFGNAAAAPMPVLAYGPDGVEPHAAATDRFAVWGQGFGSWAKWDSNDNVPGVDRSLGGVLIGGDALIGNRTRLGVLAGYSHASIDESGLDASASIDNIHLGIYGGAEFGSLSLRSGASYSWHDIGTDRLVQFTGSQERLTADYNGATAQMFGELGYRIKAGNIDLEPFANLSYANLHLDGFVEKGGAAALSARSSNTDMTFTTLGFRASTQLPIGSMQATLRSMIGWRHAYGDVTPFSRLAFTGMDTFEISGLPIARDAALLEVGFDVDLSHATIFSLSYQGQIASEVQDHGLRADLVVQF